MNLKKLLLHKVYVVVGVFFNINKHPFRSVCYKYMQKQNEEYTAGTSGMFKNEVCIKISNVQH